MNSRCEYCGCLLRFKVKPSQESLATPEQKHQLTQLALQSQDRAAIRAEYDRYGYRAVWLLSFSCSGCPLIGTWGQEHTQAEAERLAEEQNALLETPEAAHEAEHWEEEVERRAQGDAQLFATLFQEHFPQWEHCLEFLTPSDEHGVALVVRIPSANPAVTSPLEARVMNQEVLVLWDTWHTHFEIPGRPEHLQRAIEGIQSLVLEEYAIVAYYQGGKCAHGGILAAGDEPKWFDGTEQIIVRSWCGTWDRILNRESV